LRWKDICLSFLVSWQMMLHHWVIGSLLMFRDNVMVSFTRVQISKKNVWSRWKHEYIGIMQPVIGWLEKLRGQSGSSGRGRMYICVAGTWKLSHWFESFSQSSKIQGYLKYSINEICNLQENVKCLARLLESSPRQCASAQFSKSKGVFDKFHMSPSFPIMASNNFVSSSDLRTVKRYVSKSLEDAEQNDHNTQREFWGRDPICWNVMFVFCLRPLVFSICLGLLCQTEC
jgi:hypothetical protein